jgi:hypothetical protein
VSLRFFSWSFELEFREWKGNVGRAASPFAAARGIGLSSRFSPQSFLTFVAGSFGGSEGFRFCR